MKIIQIDPRDNVAVALCDIPAGEVLQADALTVTAKQNIIRGHKIALQDIAAGDAIVKYGNVIASAKTDIPAGGWVHTHNAQTNLS